MSDVMSRSSLRNKGPRDDRWYLNLMAPNTKGPKFAWLDPTSIYINQAAFGDLLDDLCAEIAPDTVDVVPVMARGLLGEPGPDAGGDTLRQVVGIRLHPIARRDSSVGIRACRQPSPP